MMRNSGNIQSVDLDALMQRMSDHLDSLAAKVFEIEEALGPAMEVQEEKDQDLATIIRLQSLDFLRQSLEDLALLSCYMSQRAPNTLGVKIPVENFPEGLKLDSTRYVVFGRAVQNGTFSSSPDGDVDLF